jgi:hypothetical protein
MAAMVVLAGLPLAAATAQVSEPDTNTTTATTTPRPGTSPAPATTPEGPPRLRMVDQSPFVSPGGPGAAFVLRFRVDNAPPDAHVLFQLHPDVASAGRIRFLESLDPQGLGRPARTVGPVALSGLPVDRDGVTTAVFETDPGRQSLVGFQLTREGVYPLAVSLREGTAGADLDTMVTDIVRLPVAARNDNPPFAFALVVPLHAPVAVRSDGAVELAPERARLLTALTDALAGNGGVPATVVPTPETIEALTVTGREGTVNRLAGALAGRQVGAGPYVDLDVGSWAADAQMGDELTRQLDEGSLALQRAFGRPVERTTWLVDTSTTPEALAELHQRGVQRAVVPEDQMLALPDGFDVTLTRTFQVEPAPGLRLPAAMADAALRNHLLDTDDPRLNAHHVFADLAVLALDQPGVPRGAVLALPAELTPPDFVDTLLRAVGTPVPADSTGKALITPVTVDGLFLTAEPAGEAGGRTRSEDGPGEPALVRGFLTESPQSLVPYPTQLARARTSVGAYRSMLSPDPSQADPLDRLLAVSGARGMDLAQRQTYLDAAVAEVQSQAALVSLPEQPLVTLTDEGGTIPLAIDNAADHSVQVKLVLTTDKLDLPEGDTTVVTLEPGSNRVDVPVQVRSSGAIPVTVTISSPDDNLPLGTTRFTVRSTAVSGLGLLLSIAAGLFLAVWWGRHFRSARRQHRLVSPTHPSHHPVDHSPATTRPAADTHTAP